MEIINIVTLSISGLLLIMVGLMRLTNPIKTFANSSGIQLEKDVNLLNEIRGISSLMMCGGIITLLGIFIPNLTTSSFMVATLIFIGFAIGRVLSMNLDGKPNSKLIQGLVSELVLGSINVFCLVN
ncbi:MAG: DUF4345 domain-containing protein [Bacteroidota bacterium]